MNKDNSNQSDKVEKKWAKYKSDKMENQLEKRSYRPLEDFSTNLFDCCKEDNFIETIDTELTKMCLGEIKCYRLPSGDFLYKIQNDKFETVVMPLDVGKIDFENIMSEQTKKHGYLPTINQKGLNVYNVNHNINLEGRTFFSASRVRDIPQKQILGEESEDVKYRGLTGMTISVPPFGDFVQTRYAYKSADKIGSNDFYSLNHSTGLEIHDGNDIYRTTILSPIEYLEYFSEKANAKGFFEAEKKLNSVRGSLESKMQYIKDYVKTFSSDNQERETRDDDDIIVKRAIY